jgi:hypothetical protein
MLYPPTNIHFSISALIKDNHVKDSIEYNGGGNRIDISVANDNSMLTTL